MLANPTEQMLNEGLSLALIDIDYFKLLNDTYGHQAGDKCLVQIADELRLFINNPSELCIRYGGEEFAIIWQINNKSLAEKVANTLLSAVRALGIPNENSPISKHVTISIGLVTTENYSYEAHDELIRRADKCLYAAKSSGRDCVVTES